MGRPGADERIVGHMLNDVATREAPRSQG
jgi:hypothetical protein